MNGRTRRAITLTMAGILVAGGLAGGGWWLGQRDDRQPAAPGVTAAPPDSPPGTVTSPPATGQPRPTTPTAAGTWRRLPAAPIPSGAYEYGGVWTGRELLLYGAVHEREGGMRAAGAAYDPATGRWHKLPPAPGPVQAMEGGFTAVWTGTGLLGGGLGLDGAYDPATNTWRKITPWGMANAVTVWTGRQVLTWGGGCCDDYGAGGAAYTPATDTWQRLPAAPLEGRHATGTWTAKELIVVGGIGKDDRGNVVGYKVFADAAAYDPATRRWRRLPPMPAPRAGATATWDGTEVLVVGGRGTLGGSRLYADGVAYNPSTNTWRRLPAMDAGRLGHTAVWTGRHLLVWGGRTLRGGAWTAPSHGAAYDPVRDRWSALPKSPLRGRTGHVAVWTGTQMLVWGGRPAREADPQPSLTDGAAYTPHPL